jgi:hypothetical protein
MKKFLTFISFTLLLSGYMLSGCINDAKIEPGVRGAGTPVINGGASLESKSVSSVEVSAEILKENGAKITERGFCYATTPSPTIEEHETAPDSEVGIGRYTLKIEGLTHNTEYYIRPYAVNSLGVEYGTPDLVVSTNEGLGHVTTLKRDVYASRAVAGGVIENAGEGEILKRGVFYSKTIDFAEKDSVESPDETDTYLCLLTDLMPSEKYYIRAFAVNTYGMFQGNIDSVLTRDGMPHVGKIESIDAGFTAVTLTSSVTNGGDETVTVDERGFCWATTSMPAVTDDTIHCGDGAGEFEGVITNLAAQQVYYVRAYAKSNFNKIHYSDEASFFTKTDVPTVKTEDAANIRNGNAEVKGVVADRGMTPIISSGICWSSTNPTPGIAGDDSVLTISIGADGVISGVLTNLKGGVTYYVRAFATNGNGTAYGEVKHFTTPPIFNSDLEPFTGSPRLENSTACFAIEGVLYLLGGDLGPACTNELWAYSIGADTWNQLQSFGGGAAKWQSGIRYGNGAYVYGGYDGNGNITPGLYYYNARINEWTEKNPGADTLYRTAGCEYGNSILYVGGKRDTVKRDVWIFDVVSDSWEKKPDFPVRQYGGIAVALNGVIYVGMGWDDQDVCNGSLWTTSDFAATWTHKTTYAGYSGSIYAGVASHQRQCIYLIDEAYYIHEYNPATDVWTRKSRLPSEYRKIHCMYDYNGKIYIGLGGAGSSLIVYDPLWDN